MDKVKRNTLYFWHMSCLNLAGPASSHRFLLQRGDAGLLFFLALMIPTYFRPFPHLGFGRAWDLPRWASRWGK